MLASAGLMAGLDVGQVSAAAVEAARTGEVPILGSDAGTEVRALVELNSTPPLMLLIERAVDPHHSRSHAPYRGGGGRSISGWTRTGLACR